MVLAIALYDVAMKWSMPAMLLWACTSSPTASNPPPDPPTFQRATRALSGVNVTWKNPLDDDFALTLVARYRGVPDGVPGTQVPFERAPFGSGTVLYTGAGTAAFDPIGPSACGSLTYQLFARDDAGQWSSGVTTSVSGTDPPPGPPTQLIAAVAGADVLLSWVLDAGTTRLLRAPDVLVYEGTATSAIDTPPPGPSATYKAYACNGCGTCTPTAATTTVTLTSVDLDAGHELRPVTLSAQLSADAGAVELSWTNPQADSGFTHVMLVRRLDGNAAAQTVYSGGGTSVSEPLPAVVAAPHSNRYTVYGCSDAFCEANGASATFAPTLLQALRAGGYTVWWRHATASTCTDQTNLGNCTMADGGGWSCPMPQWWKSCDSDCTTATARQLSPPQSDTEMSAVRTAFSSGGVVVDRVATSEFCRAVRTAEGFALGPVAQQMPELTFIVYDEAHRCSTAYALLSVPPAPGTSSAFVSHAGFTCPVLDALAPSEAAVFKPSDAGALFIRRVPYDAWWP
jgi:hypothetical protein